ncbi:MAG: hypothetical protein B6I19_02735 [Bacteroidetes bacterium 4572_114]|nr:MAG: hypothetical protein B6I19_02735 [Bacteroidetes bacterium 4572_114]
MNNTFTKTKQAINFGDNPGLPRHTVDTHRRRILGKVEDFGEGGSEIYRGVGGDGLKKTYQ